jgi:GT2 family glycosyltransferase
MKPITFCIASAKNEKEYTKLLLKSLKDHTQFNTHEVLIFIDSDNQNTYEELCDLQKDHDNIKIYRNESAFPIGSQRNVTLMFNAASNDVVCYLQSDMVVGKNFDEHINNNIDENTVLSCARIEPPLHPASPEKVVKDFGITPDTFNYDSFNKFVDELQAENRPNMVGHFAPFAVYRSTWIDRLGGFDTQFRCSREDSDTIIRMELCGLNMIQSWNACVYHFTCVSSRGDGWFKKNEDADYKNALQTQADLQELKRFIRKWGYFGHHPKPVYDVTFKIEMDHYADFNLLKIIEPYCTQMVLSDSKVAHQLASQLEFEAHYFSNLRWNYTQDHWNKVQYLFNPTDFYKRINSNQEEVGDIIVSFKFSQLISNWNIPDTPGLFQNIHEAVNQSEIGVYEAGPFIIDIRAKNDLGSKYAKHRDIDLLLNEQKFEFI